MSSLEPTFVAASRRRDLLQTAVQICIGLTPAWLMPQPWSNLWLAAGLVLGGPALYFTWHHAPWVPTPAAELPRILGALALRPDQRFCDLGCGDGRMITRVHAATGARCDGIEASPLQYALARLRLVLARSGGSVRLGDLYTADLSAYDVVYVWGTPYSVGTERFARRMRDTLRPGARLVSYDQPVPGLEPVAVNSGGQRPIYVYSMGGATARSE